MTDKEALAKQEQGEPVAWVRSDELEELSHCNGMSVWAENALIHTEDSITKQLIPSGYVPIYSKAHEDNKRIAKANYDAGYTTGYMDASVKAHDAEKQEQRNDSEQLGEPLSFDSWYLGFNSFAGKSSLLYSDLHCAWQAAKLYTTPQQRTWVGLTPEEVNDVTSGMIKGWVMNSLVSAVEAKLKEKNA